MDIGSLTGKLTLEDQMSVVLKKAEDALGKFGDTTEKQTSKLTSYGKQITEVGKSITALSVPIMAVGGAALAAGYSIEGAYNTIARKTGETGEVLEGLKKSFENVFVTVPNSAAEVSTAIADVHQRLGLTGTELEATTKKFIDFANVNAVDVATATKTVSTLMGALSEDTNLTKEEIGEASSIMDKLTYASQFSGASVTKLAEGVVKGGVAFEQMGFGLNESIALFAQFEKVGANTTDVTSSLHRVMADLASSGVTDLSGAFKGMIQDIRETDNYAQAVTKSVEIFGKKAGPKLAEEIRGGTYSVETLAATLDKLGNVTQETANRSNSFAESMGTLKNQLTLALAPLGIQLIESMKKLTPLIVDVVGAIAKLVEGFTQLPEGVQTFIIAAGGIISVLGPVIIALGTMYDKFTILGGTKGIKWIAGLFAEWGGVMAILVNPITWVVAGIVALGGVLWYFDLLDPIIEKGKEMAIWYGENLVSAFNFLKDAITDVIESGFVQLALQIGRLMILGLIEGVVLAGESFLALGQAIADVVVWLVKAAIEVGTVIVQATGLDKVFHWIWDTLKGAGEVMWNAFKKLGEYMMTAFQWAEKLAGKFAEFLKLIGKDVEMPALPKVTENIKALAAVTPPAAAGVTAVASGVTAAGTAASAASEPFDMLKTRMTKMRTDAMQPLDATTKNNIKGLHDLGFSVDEIAKGMKNVAEPAIKRYVDALEDQEKAAKKSAEEQKKLDEWIKETNQEWSRLGDTAFKASAKTTLAADQMAKSIVENAVVAHDAQVELNRFIFENTHERITNQLAQLDIENANTKLKLDKKVENYKQAEAAIDALTEARKEKARLEDEIDSSDDAFKGLQDETEAKWKTTINSIGTMFSDMFEGVNSNVAQMFKIAGAGIAAMTKEGAQFGEKLAAGFGMAAGMLSSTLDVFTEDGGGKWGQAAVGALSGAAAGAGIGTMIMPGMGTAVGAGVGAAVGAVTGWITATKKAAEAQKEATAEVQKLKQALVDQYGSLEQLEEMSTRLFGMSFVGEWGNQGAEGLKKMTEFTRDFEERLASVTGAINKMTTGFAASTSVLTEGTSEVSAAVTKAQADYDKLKESGKATDEQLALAAANVTAALEAQFVAGQNMTQTLADLGVQGVATFSAVYMATGSYTEALMAVAPAMATLQQSYTDLGLQVDDVLLSHLMLQAGVLEANPSLMAAIDGQAGAMQGMAQMGLLNAETFAAMQRTGSELYLKLQAETAAQAAATGNLGDTTVDALMPMQGYLHEATIQAELLGIPLDANTEMLIDQSKQLGIWQEAGATAQDKLIEGMDQLVGKLDQMLSNLGAMTGLLSNMPNAESTVTVNHVDRYQSVYLQDIDENANAQNRAGGGIIYAAGGFVPHGSDTVPAMLTPGERVLTTSENEQYENDKTNPSDARTAISINRLTDAILSQNETMILAMRDMILERG